MTAIEGEFRIREAVEDDLPAILAIYNEVVATSTAIYTEHPATLRERRSWWLLKRQRGFPVLVAERSGAVVGFTTFGEFRPWPCYSRSVEHSVHVSSDQRRKGVGRALVADLIGRARTLELHTIIAGVDSHNVGSLAMHLGLGFERVGELREVGRKFDRWLDLTFLQLRLSREAVDR